MSFGVKPSRRRIDRITLNLASMIDVIFLLLTYFMVTTVLARPEDRLSPAIQTQSESGSGAQQDFETQILEIKLVDTEPAYIIGSRTVSSVEDLTAILESLHKPTGLFIRSSPGVPVGFVIAGVQAAHDARFDEVTYVPAQ